MPKKKETEKKEKKENDRPKAGKKKKLSKKVIIVIAVFVIIIVLIVGLWGMQSKGEDYPTVSEVIKDKSKYINKEVEVRGTVKQDSIDMVNKTFVLTEENNDLRVNYTDLLPSNFVEGKDVVVKGMLYERSELTVEAKEIIVGCASKY